MAKKEQDTEIVEEETLAVEAEPKKEKLDAKQPEVKQFDQAEVDKLTKDLKLDRLGLIIAERAETERSYDLEAANKRREKGETVFDYDDALSEVTGFTGLTPQEYKDAAQYQNIPLADMFTRIAENSEPIKDVIESFRFKQEEAGETKEKRAVKQRGTDVALSGLKRLQTGKKKLPKKEREATQRRILSRWDPRERPPTIFDGDSEGEAEDAIVRVGQPGWARLEKMGELIINDKVAEDPERAKLWQEQIQSLGTPSSGKMIRDVLADSKFRDIIGNVTTYDLNKLSKKEGIGRGHIRADGVSYEDLKDKVTKNALYEATLLRTLNKFYLPAFISYDLIDPLKKIPNTENEDDKSWFSKAWNNASEVRVEVIGLDSKQTPVYRLDSPTWHLFEMSDAVQGAFTGAVERLAKGPEGESFLDAISEGSLEGIKDRRDLIKAALSTEAAESSDLAAVALGLLSFGGAVAFPDLFVGAASVARIAKKLGTSAADLARLRKLAPGLTNHLGDGAESLAKAEEILSDGVSDAILAGNYDEALRLLDEAQEYAKKSDTSISEARKLDKNTATLVDEMDTEVARGLSKEIPEMAGGAGNRLASTIPGTFGFIEQNIHQGLRRRLLRGDMEEQTVGFGELLSMSESIEHLKDSIRVLREGNINEQLLSATRQEASNFVSAVQDMMRKVGVGSANPNLTADQRQLSFDLVRYLNTAESVKLLRNDPKAWRIRVTELAQDLPFDPEKLSDTRKFLSELDKAMSTAVSSMKKTRASLKTKVTLEIASRSTATAVKAIRGQFESRAAAMAIMREQVAKKAGLSVDPLIISITERHEAIGRAGLSPDGMDFLDQLRSAAPSISADEAIRITKNVDNQAKKWAKQKERTVQAFYEENFAAIIGTPSPKPRPRGLAPEAPPKAPTPDAPTPKDVETPPTAKAPDEYPPAGPMEASLPPGLRAALKGLDESVFKPKLAGKAARGAFEGPVGTAPKQKPLPDIDAPEPRGNFEGWSQKPEPVGGLSAEDLYNHLRQFEGPGQGAKVVEFLMNHAALPATRAIARRILPTIKKDPPGFQIVDGSREIDRLDMYDALGTYSGVRNEVKIVGVTETRYRFGQLPVTGMDEEVILHEFIHAATAVFMDASPNNAAVRNLADLSDETLTALRKYRKTQDLTEHVAAKIDGILMSWDYYGSPKEFIAWSLSSPSFQRMLQTLELAPKTTAWNKFTRLIAKLFGITAEDETGALAQVLVANDQLLRAASKFDRSDVDFVSTVVSDAEPIVALSEGVTKVTSRMLEFIHQEGVDKDLGEALGEMLLRENEVFGSKVFQVDSVEIPKRVTGQGLGTDLYLRALKHAQNEGVGFVSDLTPTEDAVRVYNKLQNLGVKFARKPLPDAQGELTDVYFISSRDLAKLDIDKLAVKNGKRLPPEILDPDFGRGSVSRFAASAGDFATNPVVVDFMEDGRAVIRALTETATADDFMLAIGRVTRRNFDESDMKALVTWLGAKGIKVGHRGSVLTADDAAAVETAEQEFAKAFLHYIKSGRADEPEIQGALSKANEWLKDTYTSITSRSAGGPLPGTDPDLTRSLDKLLRTRSDRVALPNVFKVMTDAMLSSAQKEGTKFDILDEIYRELYRLGHPISKVDLEKKWADALKRYDPDKADRAVIQLPVAINIGGALGKPKDRFSLTDLAKAQKQLEQARLFEIQPTKAVPLPIGGAEKAIAERSASELTDQAMLNRPIGRVARNIFMGGDAYADMRNLPPAIRESVKAGERLVQQAIGDAITLVVEGDLTNLMRYLTGTKTVQFAKGGRSAISAGHDSVTSVVKSLGNYFKGTATEELGEVQIQILQDYVSLVRERGSASEALKDITQRTIDGEKVTQRQIIDGFNAIVKGDSSNRFIKEAFEAAGYKSSEFFPQFLTQPKGATEAGGLLEAFMYYANLVERLDPSDNKRKLYSTMMSDAGIVDVPQNTFIRLYEDITGLFPAEDKVANRVAILVAAHGMAHKAKLDWVKMGVAANEELASAVNMYLVGEKVSDEILNDVKRFVDLMGYNPRMVDVFNLEGVKMYLPNAARNRLAMAMSQANDPAIVKSTDGTLFDALNTVMAAGEDVITKGTNTAAKLNMALIYRYLKTRMVRGHFVLKSRYFWMNTFDHFNQTALRAGYGTAFVSTTRMFTQNVLSNPLGQAAVFAARRANKGEEVEAFRRVLQAGGDKAAQWAKMFSRGAKWHINVNDVIRGGDEIVLLGGKPYVMNDLRQTFLEAGIFASFDTSQLGTKIENVGNLFLLEQQKQGKLSQMGKEILGDMKGASEDIAEAWAERERAGLAVTLIEGGMDPRTAARIAVEALYDYAGSMSKGDRNFLVNLFFPFWAFQKNANRQIFDTIFSPEGAYRLGVMRRAYDKGSDALSELVYAASVDENGIYVDGLPDDLRQTYFALKNAIYSRYEVDGRIPPIVREELRLFVSGSVVRASLGQLRQTTELTGEFIDIARDLKDKEGQPLLVDRRALAAFYVPRTDRSSMPNYLHDKISLRFPYLPDPAIDVSIDPEIPGEFKQSMKTWTDLYRQTRPDAPYLGFFLPEPTYTAGMNHFTYLASAMLLTIGEIEELGDAWFTDEDDGSDAISPITPLNALLNTERTIGVSDAMATMGIGGSQIPRKVHPAFAFFADYTGLDVLELDERDDAYSLLIEREKKEAEGEDVDPLPLKRPGVKTRTDKVYYLMPGVMQLAFNNSPFGEANDILLKMEKTSPEKAAGMRGDLQAAIRTVMGLGMRDITRQRTAAAAKWQAEEDTSRLTRKKAQPGQRLK